jgi:PadR family transcriptional regulator PadR
MKIHRELMRGAGPVAVLKLLSHGEMYGYQLVQSLSKSGALEMGQSTLYPMLYNLEAKGLIQAEWRDTESARKRKYYSLTALGRERLASEIEQWRALADAMVNIGVLGPAGGGPA